MSNFFEVMTVEDIGLAALMALLITFVIKGLMKGQKFFKITGDIRINYDIKNFKNVLKNCYDLFPNDSVPFRGATFKRGMRVQVLTSKNHVIKGEIVGLNNENMLCLITSKYIVAHELSQILNITPIADDTLNGGE